MNKKEVIAFWDCDEWKSKDSMRLIAIAEVDNAPDIWLKIKSEHDYTDEDMETYIYTETFTLNEYE